MKKAIVYSLITTMFVSLFLGPIYEVEQPFVHVMAALAIALMTAGAIWAFQPRAPKAYEPLFMETSVKRRSVNRYKYI